MKKLTSKSGKEFYLVESISAAVDNLPCFTQKELACMAKATFEEATGYFELKRTATTAFNVCDFFDDKKEVHNDSYKKTGSSLSPQAQATLSEIYKKLGRKDNEESKQK